MTCPSSVIIDTIFTYHENKNIPLSPYSVITGTLSNIPIMKVIHITLCPSSVITSIQTYATVMSHVSMHNHSRIRENATEFHTHLQTKTATKTIKGLNTNFRNIQQAACENS